MCVSRVRAELQNLTAIIVIVLPADDDENRKSAFQMYETNIAHFFVKFESVSFHFHLFRRGE